MKLGIIVFANNSGLGEQTRRLTYMLKPERILAIDSSGFSKNKKQNFGWYSNFNGYKVQGFPTNREINVFLTGLTHILVAENPLNFFLLDRARQLGVKVFIQSNYEFCDHLNKELTLPYKFLMPSHWMNREMKEKFGNIVEYLPPPINPNDFKEAREINFARGDINNRPPRFLHIVGTLAANDRNGTLDLLKATEFTTAEFELVIRSQHELPREYLINDRRVKYIIENVENAQDMYKDFDLMFIPRKYGGLCLTANEGLMSGLPVFMTDISPNSELLPKEWLIEARKTGEFMTRTMINIYSAYSYKIADKIDWICEQDLNKMKIDAFSIAYDNFSETVLKPKYEKILNE